MSASEALEIFYKSVSRPEGINIGEFQAQLKSLFAGQREDSDVNDYRRGKKPWKKLRDEIVPVANFLLMYRKIKVDRVWFPLDNKTPDSWLILENGDSLGVEVTVERGRERFHLAKELNEKNEGRGFIGVQDDSSQTEFDNQMSNPRTMFTTDQALEATKAGVIRCLTKKNAPRFKNVHFLIIESHLTVLPKECWCSIVSELSLEAAKLPFHEVYVIGDTDENPWGFQIK